MKQKNIPKDTEAYNEWKKVITKDRILLGNKKIILGNGDTGPCGPLKNGNTWIAVPKKNAN